MKIAASNFLISAAQKGQFPADDRPEFVFCGRSNVGKSSLINTLLGRRGLAKTSSTPGKTRTINFYDVDGKFRFVDLPGYGYAKVSKAEKAEWPIFIETYLRERKRVVCAFLLLDARRTPNEDDLNMYRYLLHFGHEVIILVTKTDKQNQRSNQKVKQLITQRFEISPEHVFLTSSSKGTGKYRVWDKINELFKERDIDIVMERQIDKDNISVYQKR